jgi:hypothetical protein
MKSSLLNLKNSMIVLSILLFIVSFGIVILLLATGHEVNFKDTESQKVIFLIILYLITGVLIIAYVSMKKRLLKKVIIFFLLLILISLFYLLYLFYDIKAVSYEALIPVGILLIVMFLDIKVLYYLLK